MNMRQHFGHVIIGWLGAALTAAAMLTGLAALALTVRPPPAIMMPDMETRPPAAPVLAAVSEMAPEIPPQPAAEAPAAAKARPAPESAPSAMDQAVGDQAVRDQTVPPPEPVMPALPDIVLPVPRPAPKKPAVTDETAKKIKRPVATPSAKTRASASAPSAPQMGAQKGGAVAISAPAYAKTVMKKVRSTPKRAGTGKGTALVGFKIAQNGRLAWAGIIRSSGNGAFDEIALDHIRRAAPFSPPPPNIDSRFSFEFVGK